MRHSLDVLFVVFMLLAVVAGITSLKDLTLVRPAVYTLVIEKHSIREL